MDSIRDDDDDGGGGGGGGGDGGGGGGDGMCACKAIFPGHFYRDSLQREQARHRG